MDNRKIIILDRDGVINHDSDEHIKSPQQWIPIPGSLEAIARLYREDYEVIVMTNQSGIARGYYSINTLNRIHQKMMEELHHLGGEISAVFFCPHSDEDDCPCRKPRPGMFLELAQRLKCNLKEIYAVGDSLRDLQAAQSADAIPILVKTGKGEKTIEAIKAGAQGDKLTSVRQYDDLAQFVDQLLSPAPV